MAGELAQFRSATGIPDPGRAILLAVAMVAPSGAKATDRTQSMWPVSWRSSAPVRASQIRAVPSRLPVASMRAVGAESHREHRVSVAGELAQLLLRYARPRPGP